MGRTAVILVLVMMILVGTVSIILYEKQHHSVDKVVATTQGKQARYLANSYAKSAVKDLKEMAIASGGLNTNLEDRINEYNMRPPIVNIAQNPNASVQIHISHEDYQGTTLAANEFAITATATINGDDGNVYSTKTHLVFTYGGADAGSVVTLPPPATGPSSVDNNVRVVQFILQQNQISVGYSGNNNTNNLYSSYPGSHNNPTNINVGQLQASGYSYVIQPGVPSTGNNVPVRLAVHYSSFGNPFQFAPTYPLNIYVPARANGNTKAVRIDSHFYALDQDYKNLKLYVDGNVTIAPNETGTSNGNITQANMRIYASIYATGTITVDTGHGSTITYTPPDGTDYTGRLMETANGYRKIYIQRVTRYELAELWDERQEDETSDPSSWTLDIKGWIEETVKID